MNKDIFKSKIIEVDDIKYPFECFKDKNQYSFKYKDTDDKWYELKVTVTDGLINDMKDIFGLALDKELENIIVEEMKLEISKAKDGEYWRSKLNGNRNYI